MGWRDSLKDPTERRHAGRQHLRQGARSSTDHRADARVQGQNKLILDRRTKTNGLFTVPDDADRRDTSRPSTMRGTTITADKLFDMSVLTEVYQENPDLMTDPTA